MSIRSTTRFALLVAGTAAAVACGGDTAPETPKAASLQAVGTAAQTATVGTAVTAVPAVRAVSAAGAPVPGVVVTFAVTAGSGTLGATSATTGADGTASAKSWTLGTTSGTNTVTATAPGLSPVTFTASGTAAAAASLSAVAGDNQSAAIGTAVATAPAVVVRDQYSNPVSGAAVTFSVDAGGGTLTGASATSGADGIARVGSWTLGIAAGAQRIKATSGSLSATIGATGTIPTGCTPINYALGATLSLNWEANDCKKQSGRRYDKLTFTTTTQQQVDAIVTGPNGRILQLMRADSLFVGLQPGTAFSPPTQNPMHLKYLLGPGTYTFEPIAPDSTTTGAYTFSTTTNTKVDCDYIVFGTPGITVSDSIVNTKYNCSGPSGFMEQWVNLQLRTGMKMRLTLTSEFPAIFILRDDRLGPASPTLVRKQGNAGETLVIDWTATFDSWHEIVIAPTNAAGGKYTLKIEQLP